MPRLRVIPPWSGIGYDASQCPAPAGPIAQDRGLGGAGHAYAEEQHRHFSVIHTLEDWLRSMFLETGPEADARRTRALPLLAHDGTRMPDLFGRGPDAPINDTVRRRFFGEE
jgi:hypothetical protein